MTLRLALHGIHALNSRIQAELIVSIRHVLEPLVRKAGKKLAITTNGNHIADLNLTFDTKTTGRNGSGQICGDVWLGDDVTQIIWVRAHTDRRVCGSVNQRGERDLRRFLTTDSLIGRALANTAIHELGHWIADLEHVEDLNNFMSWRLLPVAQRTVETMRKDYAGKKIFTDEQEGKLVKQLKAGEWLGVDLEMH